MKWILGVKIAIGSMKKEGERRWVLSQMGLPDEMLQHLDLSRTTYGTEFVFDDRETAWKNLLNMNEEFGEGLQANLSWYKDDEEEEDGDD